MRLKVLSCEKFQNSYKITFQYVKGETFYPDGKGGQIGDLGVIGDASIIKVAEDFILIDKPLSPDSEYAYSIDCERRDDARENHTGEHIFSALAFLKYGWRTSSFRMSENYSTIDFDVSDVTDDMVNELEKEVNLKIKEGVEVSEEICDFERASYLLGERKSIPDKAKGDIRIMSTFPEDFNACAGLHTENTKDVRLFKILSYERVKSNFTRFYFVSGNKAIDDYKEKHEIISKLVTKLSCQPKDIINMFDKIVEEKKETEKGKKELEIRYGNLIFDKLLLTPFFYFKSQDEIEAKAFYINETKEVNDNIKKLFQNSNMDYLLITYSEDNYSVLSNFLDCQYLLNEVKKNFEIRGGGNSKGVNFKFLDSNSLIPAFLKSVLL